MGKPEITSLPWIPDSFDERVIGSGSLMEIIARAESPEMGREIVAAGRELQSARRVLRHIYAIASEAKGPDGPAARLFRSIASSIESAGFDH